MSDNDPQALTIRAAREIERSGDWMLVRRSLGLAAFGLNIVEIPPGETIPEHDEIDRDQEEVFLALDDGLVLIVGGVEHALPAATFARLDPELRRTARNDAATPARLLITSAPRTSGYEPMAWA